MAKATKPAGRPSAPQARAEEHHLRRRPHQELVQQHDRLHRRPRGQRPGLGLGRQRRVQGLPQVHPVRRPAGRRAVRQAGHGARRAPGRRARPRPGLGPRDRHPLARRRRHRGRRHQGRHPHPAQRLPPQEAAAGVGTGTKGTKDHHGSLHRTRLPALPPGAHQALPQGRALLLDEVPRLRGGHRPPQPRLPARRARPRPHAPGVGVPRPAAREAEGPPHLRPAREAVPQPLRRGQPGPGHHR